MSHQVNAIFAFRALLGDHICSYETALFLKQFVNLNIWDQISRVLMMNVLNLKICGFGC